MADDSSQPTCGHPDRKIYAKGKCRSCYNSDLRVKQLEAAKTDEQVEAIAEKINYTSDEWANSFLRIMWSWVNEYQSYMASGNKEGEKPPRHTAEAANKAATVLGRAYVVERTKDETPVELPLHGVHDYARGWLESAGIIPPSKKADA